MVARFGLSHLGQGAFDAPLQSRAQEVGLDDVEEAGECRDRKAREEQHGYEEAYARFLANRHRTDSAPNRRIVPSSRQQGGARAFYSLSAPGGAHLNAKRCREANCANIQLIEGVFSCSGRRQDL